MKNLTSDQLRSLYLKFFEERGHKVIPSASLIPENDPSVLFTTAGMHPLVPYLMGQEHPRASALRTCRSACARAILTRWATRATAPFLKCLATGALAIILSMNQ